MDAANLTIAVWLLIVLNKHYDRGDDWTYAWGKKGALAHFAVSLFMLAVVGFNLHYGLNG